MATSKSTKAPNRVRTQAGKELAKIRIDQDETLNRMAERIGVHPVHLSKVTTGTAAFTIGIAERVREVYGVDLTKFVSAQKRRITFELDDLSPEDQATVLAIYGRMANPDSEAKPAAPTPEPASTPSPRPAAKKAAPVGGVDFIDVLDDLDDLE
jgi:transcriptional regulator with XRE-family HTH domain